MAKLTGVEIFAAGNWNGMQFSKEDLNDIAKAWKDLSKVHKVPLKLGHNEEQPMTDGFPALGWVTNVYVKGDKLVADFDHMPDAVFKAIQSKMYNAVSIELDIGVEYKNKEFPLVLSGVALLGADLPAVNTLEDLSTYTQQTFSSRLGFMSFTSTKLSKGTLTMSTENTGVSKAEFSALQEQVTKLITQNATLTTENATLKAEKEAADKSAKTAAFTAKKEKAVATLDALVKVKKITPAQRENFSKDITEENIDVMTKTIGMLSDGEALQFSTDKETALGSKGKERDNELPVDQVLLSKISQAQLQHGYTFSQARSVVFQANPELARKYISMHDEEEGAA